MKIGIFCTTNYPYPLPKGIIYANHSVAGELADELTQLGHEVTFFAPEGTETKATLVTFDTKPFSDEKIHNAYTHPDASYHYETIMLIKALHYMQDNNFDIFHSHSRPFSVIEQAALTPNLPTVITVHDPVDDDGYKILPWYNQFKNLHFISISKEQQKPLPDLSWSSNVYNGIDTNSWTFSERNEGYLLFVGRIMPEKGPDTAVQVAKKMNMRLKIAGTLYKHHQSYFDKKIKPYLSNTIEYLGPFSHDELKPLYAHALGLMMPNRWSEPFGLVAIEAMASGTPVIGTNRGSLPEIIKNGETGFLIDDPEDLRALEESVSKLSGIDRISCSNYVKNNFSRKKMAEKYVSLYKKITV